MKWLANIDDASTARQGGGKRKKEEGKGKNARKSLWRLHTVIQSIAP